MLSSKTSMGAVLLSLVLTTWVNAQESKGRVYIWDFVDNKGQRIDLTDRITSEFEEALTQANCYQVLERRQFGKLLDHIKNEKTIADLDDISKRSQGEIKKITNAQIVVFGKVDDDVASGEYKISVTFQHFDSSKEVKSIRIRRGRIQDTESRESAMKELVREICGVRNTSSVAGKYILSKNAASYIELKSDGTIFFSLIQYGSVVQGVGSYDVDGKQITLKVETGWAARGILEKDKISFDSGDVFVRGSAGTVSASPPASPGITISQAIFMKSASERVTPSQLTIGGIGWDGGSDTRIIVNGQDISKRIDRQMAYIILLKGTMKELNIRDGKNEVVVVVDGVRSNQYEFKQAIR